MATEAFIASWSGGSGYSRVDSYESGRNNSSNYVDVYWWVGSRGTWGSISGTWDWSRGGTAGGASGSIGAATGIRGVQSGTKRIYGDVNGNYSNFALTMYWDMYYGTGTASRTIGFSRSPLAPTNAAPTSSAVGVTSATLNGSVSSHGHGTSSTIYLSYKKASVGSWTDLSSGSSKAITGLTPGTVYQMRSKATNNNGDANGFTSGTYEFTTLPAPNISNALLGVVGVL